MPRWVLVAWWMGIATWVLVAPGGRLTWLPLSRWVLSRWVLTWLPLSGWVLARSLRWVPSIGVATGVTMQKGRILVAHPDDFTVHSARRRRVDVSG
ncbi:hypothetical protein [Gordonia jinhuaensis]|uniref:hypothetical protein n=1 Tax=Gordonia jinhuaensis TaxID=1517702 RepID=UPI001E453CBB|nr:hypothetical protein [Gordonia jinhuaensis]